MYKSSYEPWSSDLVSERGKEPGYDPLAFVVEEAHKRGIEVHAWMNPYRFSTASTYWDGQAGDYRETHPEWILTYPVQNGKYNAIMNPALPEVRQRITDIVREVVTNYDVDGIVFDDYFYAYGGTPADLDADAQQKYKPEDMIPFTRVMYHEHIEQRRRIAATEVTVITTLKPKLCKKPLELMAFI